MQVPGGCETPSADRTTEIGCYVSATQELGVFPQPAVFWHLYEYPSRAAAQAAADSRGTVVESFGKVWLFTIAEMTWMPNAGKRIAVVGPLQTRGGIRYTARYMEAVFPPTLESRNLVHRHPGPEAWYLLEGAQCLETPEGITIVRAGQSGVIAEGPPMSITVIGNQVRRAVALVLHDTSQPWAIMVHDWQPKGSCPR
jgi:hypothetical protein